LSTAIKSKVSSIEGRLASKAPKSRELTLDASLLPVNNGYITLDGLRKVHDLTNNPTVGQKSWVLVDQVICREQFGIRTVPNHRKPNLISVEQTSCAGGLWLLAVLLSNLVMWAGFGWIVLRVLELL
jgi:hypothetical protein